jgi:hypothetical protein
LNTVYAATVIADATHIPATTGAVMPACYNCEFSYSWKYLLAWAVEVAEGVSGSSRSAPSQYRWVKWMATKCGHASNGHSAHTTRLVNHQVQSLAPEVTLTGCEDEYLMKQGAKVGGIQMWHMGSNVCQVLKQIVVQWLFNMVMLVVWPARGSNPGVAILDPEPPASMESLWAPSSSSFWV